MSDYESYIHYGRLVVILQFILIPIYFYLLSFVFVGGVIWFLDTPDLRIISDIIIYGIGPLFMAFPFLFWTYGKRYQIGDTYETFGKEVWRLPTTIKAFYGFNFIVGIIFGFPLVTPLISLFGGYFIAVYLLGWREEDKLVSKQRKTWLLTILYMPIPLLVVIGFFFGYNLTNLESGILGFFLQLISIWNGQIDVLYTSALILADCATFGGVIYLIYEGAQQVDQTVEIPTLLITVLSFVGYLILETLYLLYEVTFGTFLYWIHIVAVILGVLMLIIRYWKGLISKNSTSITGWFTLVLFQAINFFSGPFEQISRSTAIIVAFSIFLFLFYMAYRKASLRY